MRVLNLSDNSLKEEGGVEIAKILKSLPQLTVGFFLDYYVHCLRFLVSYTLNTFSCNCG